MPRTPSEYSVHLLLDGGHREEVRFATLQIFKSGTAVRWCRNKIQENFLTSRSKIFKANTW